MRRRSSKKLGYDPQIWRLVTTYVRWTSGSAVVELPPQEQTRLEGLLGPRFHLLDGPVAPPTLEERRAEIERQVEKGVDPEIAAAVADLLILQQRMAKQGRPALLERETLAWEALNSAAVAAAALDDASAEALAAADEYFELLDAARAVAGPVRNRHREEIKREIKRGRHPAIQAMVTRRNYTKMARRSVEARKEQVEDVWEIIREEGRRLVEKGKSKRSAAKIIAASSKVREKCENAIRPANKKPGDDWQRPWRGDFYSEDRILRILRKA